MIYFLLEPGNVAQPSGKLAHLAGKQRSAQRVSFRRLQSFED